MRHPFLRTLAGSAAPAATDPNFENVTLLLHGDGTNGGQNNTFVDGSTNNFTITRNGNTTQGTFSPYGDNWSNFFDGTGDYLTVPDNAAFDFGTGDFTIELWVYIAGNSALNNNSTRDVTVFGSFPTSTVGSLTNSWGFNLTGNGTTTGVGLNFSNWQSGSNSVISATVTIPQTSWNHIAVARSGTTTKLFLNGAEVGSGTLSNQTVNSGQNLAVGRLGYPGYIQELNGYISNLRVLKGAAQYTGSYTVPTAPLTAITNTSLLTCQSNRFRDASANNFTITRNGDVSVQRFSPFSPTAAYAAGTIGGSGFFNGVTNYLSAASNAAFSFGTGNFTIECFFYPTSTDSSQYLYLLDSTGGITFGFEPVSTVASFVLGRRATAVDLSATYTIVPFQWLHLVAVRSGTTASLYINGTRVATGTNSLNYTVSGPVNVGAIATASTYEANGYISNLRVVKGTAVYDPAQSTLTVPTAPLTAITNTSLLLNFTNAAILDNAMMAVPETIGNAQIDTTIKKYGTGSMKFDGTGDYLVVPNNAAFNFGTGDFTIECWVYIAGNSSLDGSNRREAGIFCPFPTSGSVSNSYGFQITGDSSTTGTGLAFVSYQSNIEYLITGTATISQNTWHHIAVARSGTTTRLFLNGSQVGSGTLGNQTVNTSFSANIGRLGYTSYLKDFNGYIDDLRVTKGVARYTAAFTPPTAALPDL